MLSQSAVDFKDALLCCGSLTTLQEAVLLTSRKLVVPVNAQVIQSRSLYWCSVMKALI